MQNRCVRGIRGQADIFQAFLHSTDKSVPRLDADESLGRVFFDTRGADFDLDVCNRGIRRVQLEIGEAIHEVIDVRHEVVVGIGVFQVMWIRTSVE